MLTTAVHDKKLGIKQMQWQTLEEGHNAIAFYNKMGVTDKAKRCFFCQL